jgi:transposase
VLGVTIAAEIGDVARFPSPRKPIGYSGLAPRVKQSGELSKAGSRKLRFAAVQAAQGAWRETNPWHRLYSDVKARTGKANPGKSAVARKVLIACWHVLSREEPFKPHRPHTDPVPASSRCFLAA